MSESYEYYIQLPFWELIAVITALAYVVFAARENIWCWPMAMLSTVIYTVVFYDVYLWSDSLLQVYYFGMAVYGWYCWRNIAPSDPQSGFESHQKIQSWSIFIHVKAIGILTALAMLVGWLMDSYTPTSFPYLDALTTVFAVFATYLVTKKVLQNWLYWIAIDALSIYLYIEKDLLPTAVLFILYVIIAIYGYMKWQKAYDQKRSTMHDLSPESS